MNEGKDAILEIRNLGINFSIREGTIRALDNVDLDFPRGKITAVIGESGCGKSTLANSILGLFAGNSSVDPLSKILFEGKNILGLGREELRKFRWQQASMVFQSAQSSLNPTMNIEDQLVDSILDHEGATDRAEAMKRVSNLLKMVNLDAGMIMKSFPHQISGGMKQRVIIALALTLNPQLVVLDEPTTALDVITQNFIFDILSNIHAAQNLTMILITHDIELAGNFADSIVVMYGGEVFEVVSAAQMLKKPGHPYTEGLLHSIPRVSGERVEIKPIPGHPPDLINKPVGCIFRPRCEFAKEICETQKPKLVTIGDGWVAACHFAKERAAS